MIEKTYEQAQREMAQIALATDVVTAHCRGDDLENLRKIADGLSSKEWCVLGADFNLDGHSWGGECTFSVTSKQSRCNDKRIERYDEEGNFWTRVAFEVKVGYPSYGGTSPATVKQRIDLIVAVTDLALELEQNFCSPDVEIWRLSMTKEDIAANDASAAQSRLDSQLKEIIVKNRKHLRVGAEREVGSNPDNIPAGTYTSALDDKTYELEVSEQPACCGIVMVLRRVQ